MMRQYMKTRLLVISDLHLGGSPATGDSPAFQMCTAAGRAHLVRFIEWAARPDETELHTHLVIAGDVVDFLAEEAAGSFLPFTVDDRLALDKLMSIFKSTAEVWEALRRFVARGHALTVMLGNHDLELCLPGPRHRLLDVLGPGRIEFIYDNQAFTLGPVLVEHGNRYDDWNAVPHDDLREVRSRLSRGERAEFDALPGSRMVVDLVNPTKKKLSFVDLLKPEDATLLPFLALLAPDRYAQVVTTLKNRIRALRVRYGADQQPKDRNFIGAPVTATPSPVAGDLGTGEAADDALLALADAAAAGGDPGMISSGGSFLDRWVGKLATAYRQQQLDLLLKVLRALHQTEERAFDVETENETYLRPATEMARRGYEVIVYGHTHLAKRVRLAGRTTSDGSEIRGTAVYLNSGTWADLMALPSGISAPEGSPGALNARARLVTFADDLAANRVDAWRRQLPTFVRVELDDTGRVTEAVLEMLGDRDELVSVTTKVLRERLAGGSA
jgi:UDP-2,3-diacylglucosamine pyrophosphatase LpxH